MRIAILNWRDAAHPDAGGAELIVHQMARLWSASGHDVTLYSSSRVGLSRTDTREGFRIVRLGRLKDGTHHLMAPRACARNHPDVVLESINTLPYMLPLRRSVPPSLPLIHQLAVDVWHAHLPQFAASLMARLEPILWRPYRGRPTVAYSRSTAADLHSVGIRRVEIIPQGGKGPQPPGRKAAEPTLLFAGRLARNKRPDHAVDAFRHIRRQLPSARLWIVGDGEMSQELAANLPPGAELLGRLDHRETVQRMGQAHLVLVPSIREGWGLVVTEANSVGTPAVAYDVPGLRDSVRHLETGILTPPRPEALGQHAVSLLSNPDEYSRLRENAISWGGALTWEAMAGALLHQLRKALAGVDNPKSVRLQA